MFNIFNEEARSKIKKHPETKLYEQYILVKQIYRYLYNISQYYPMKDVQMHILVDTIYLIKV